MACHTGTSWQIKKFYVIAPQLLWPQILVFQLIPSGHHDSHHTAHTGLKYLLCVVTFLLAYDIYMTQCVTSYVVVMPS